jgi:hypothetical protein
MIPLRPHHGRQGCLLAGFLAVALSTLGSCDADRFELTLRSRDGLSLSSLERPWLAADGRRATSPAYTVRFLSAPTFGDVECGGRQWTRRYFSIASAALGPYELEIDGGSRLTLDPQTAVEVSDGTGTETACFEEVGLWRGTAGDVVDRTGRFTLHFDSIQAVLRLVED